MGDRVLVVFHDGNRVSPVAYMHWGGAEAPQYIRDLAELMAGRTGDVSYAFARFLGICHVNIPGNLSLGCWNADEFRLGQDIKYASRDCPERGQAIARLEALSHGNAGLVAVDCRDFTWTAYGGYLTNSADECEAT